MSLMLSTIAAAPYDYFSTGDGSKPISIGEILDKSGGTVVSDPLTVYLVATDFRYDNILLQLLLEQAGIDWQLSLDGNTWGESISVPEMDALAADVVTPIYLRVEAANDGSLGTGRYTGAKIELVRTENP